MKTWKKAGLTALAGSLVATSAFAGAMTVSGGATLTYTGETGAEDSSSAAADSFANDGGRWGMNKTISFSGSGEMDNGWTVSYASTLSDAASSAVGITLDMGDAGSLNYEGGTGGRGIGKIADMMPYADDGYDNGLDWDGSGTVGGVTGKVSGGTQGFHYSKAMDMIEIGVGYAPKGQAGSTAGGTNGSGAKASATSAFVKIDPIDGLEIGFGVGEAAARASGDASQTDDHSTIYATYVYGPLTIGYQVSEVDTYTSTESDDESTNWGVLYAVNDEMSINYVSHENDDSTLTTDEEATGWGASYTSGSMTFKAHRNKATNLGNVASRTSEHTEIGVTFAF
jgi:outer membrane protein OmpU